MFSVYLFVFYDYDSSKKLVRYLCIKYFVRRLSKILKKHNFIFFSLNPALLHEHYQEKQKEIGTTYQSNMFRNLFYSEIYHLTNFGVLIQGVSWVIQNIVYPNLCRHMTLCDCNGIMWLLMCIMWLLAPCFEQRAPWHSGKL